MNLSGCLRVLLLTLILAGLEAVTVVHHHPDNEYVLEHEVTYEAAIAEARKLQLFHGEIIFQLFLFCRKYILALIKAKTHNKETDSLNHFSHSLIYFIITLARVFAFFDLSLYFILKYLCVEFRVLFIHHC